MARMTFFSISTDDEEPQKPRQRWHTFSAFAGGTTAAVLGGLLLPPVQQMLGHLLR